MRKPEPSSSSGSPPQDSTYSLGLGYKTSMPMTEVQHSAAVGGIPGPSISTSLVYGDTESVRATRRPQPNTDENEAQADVCLPTSDLDSEHLDVGGLWNSHIHIGPSFRHKTANKDRRLLTAATLPLDDDTTESRSHTPRPVTTKKRKLPPSNMTQDAEESEDEGGVLDGDEDYVPQTVSRRRRSNVGSSGRGVTNTKDRRHSAAAV